MKAYPTPHQIRKTIKWGGAAATVLLVVVWIGSGWWYVQWMGGEHADVTVTCGMFSFEHVRPDWWDPGFRFGLRAEFWLDWGFLFRGPEGEHLIWVPLWLPSLLAAVVCMAAWRLDTHARRHAGGRLNLCPKCNYDRAGFGKGTVCPDP